MIDFLTSTEVVDFIYAHEYTDPQKLLLNPPGQFKAHIKDIVDQIISRGKARTKLPEWYHSEGVIFPPPLSIEQSSSYSTGNYKAQLITGNHLIDLTGGMGIDTLTLSKKFSEAIYVEQSKWLCKVFEHNSKLLSKKHIEVHNTSAEEFLAEYREKATFFIDPARRDEHQKRVFRFEDCSPNVVELLPVFKEKADQVLIKAAPLIDLTLAIDSLQYVSQVHIVAVKNEVKEVLFLLEFDEAREPLVTCVNLETKHPALNFLLSKEKQIHLTFGQLKKYLYDPNTSILKAGAFKTICEYYPLNKIAANTHLYTSEQLINSFPGRTFEVIDAEVNKKTIKKLLPDAKANVLTKNYPLKPEELKKQLKIKDGGEYFIVGFRDLSNKTQLCLVKPVSESR